ncbi:MAG: DedA family protein [Proteobacteria bacterium]|nr:DedA family protein [Pseudomonadota bacterium]
METGWVQSLFDWVQDNPNWTGILIFLFAFTESLLLVGIVFPGAAFLIGIGTLTGLGVLDFYTAWLWASLGGFFGDGLSFWIGHKYKKSLLKMWPIYKFPELIEKGQKFFIKHGGVSVFIGRFIGPIRPIIPAIAGIMEMPVKKYLAISIIASVLWAPFYMLPGLLFGTAMDKMAQVAGKLAVLLLVLVVLVWFVYWLVSLIYRFFVPRTYRILSKTLAWTQRHPILGKITSGLVDPRKPEKGSLAMLASILLVVTVLAIIVLANNETMSQLSLATDQFFISFHNPWTVMPMKYLLFLGHDLTILMVVIALSAWFVYRRLYLVLWHWLFVAVSAYVLAVIIGFIGHGQWDIFASHHLAWLTAVCVWWSILVSGSYPAKWRSWPYVVSGVIVILSGFSSLFFFQLSLEMLIISILIASIWSMAIGIAFRTRNRKQFLGFPIKLIFFVSLLVTSSLGWFFMSEKQVQSKPMIENLSTEHRRTNWMNQPKQSLNITFETDLEFLQNHLEAEGWKTHRVRTWGGLYQAMIADAEQQNLPIISTVNHGEIDALIMSKAFNDGIVSLHLWPEHRSSKKHWVGLLTSRHHKQVWFVFNLWAIDATNTADDSILIDALKTQYFAVDKSKSGQLKITQKKR